MADTYVQQKCQKWVSETWLSSKFNLGFAKKSLTMQQRGECEFNAVSTNGKIVANISTAQAHTYRGSTGSAKKSKLRADCLMLHLAVAEKKLMILTEKSMYKLANKEQEEGRLPLDIEILYVELPDELKHELSYAQEKASREMRNN